MPKSEKIAGLRIWTVHGKLTKCQRGTRGATGVPRRDMAWAAAMSDPKSPRSLGCLFAILPLVGAFVLGYRGEPVIGLLLGFGLALVLVVIYWLIDRGRQERR